jgi:phosphoenolpyruvate carboxykinase (GTP)
MALETAVIASSAPANAPDELVTWVAGVADLAQPDAVHWCDGSVDRKSTRLNSSHRLTSRMPSSA